MLYYNIMPYFEKTGQFKFTDVIVDLIGDLLRVSQTDPRFRPPSLRFAELRRTREDDVNIA